MALITVLGIADGEPILPALRERVMAARLIASGARHLALFPEARGERFVIGNNIPELVTRLRRALASDEEVVVLASGDPLLYGIGATLRRHFAADQLEIIPAVSSFQRAFAVIGEPWQDALLLSAHGRPAEAVIAALTPPRKAAILTDAVNTPAALAGQLLDANGDCPAVVCERLGTPEQRIVRGTLNEIARQAFDPLNVMVLLPEGQDAILPDNAYGVPNESLEHDGLITHLEVRAVSIAYLRLRPASVLWDIGAGSGSVAIDAARVACRGTVYAVERDPVRYDRLCRNLKTHGALLRVHPLRGEAPQACADWPAPDAVFVGGSGGRLEAILAHAAARLRPEGRVVINLVTLDRVSETMALLREHGFAVNVTQISVARSRPLQDSVYLAALNPVLVVTAERS